MIRKKIYRQILFYVLFALFICWTVIEPEIHLSVKYGCLIILFVFLIHSLVEKRHLYKKLAVKYKNQSDLLNSIFMNCPDLIYMKDSDLRYIDCNPVMKKMLCIDNESSIAKKTDFDFYSKETADTIRSYDKKVIDNAGIVSYKIEKQMFNGETKIYDSLLAPIVKKDEISGVLGILRDVTTVEQLKERILIQNAQLNSILDNIPFMLYMKDLEGRVITCNSRVEKNIGISREKLIGLPSTNIYVENNAEKIKQEDEQVIKTKQALIIEVQSSTYTNTPVWYEVPKSPILDINNDIIGIIVIVKNIDSEKRREEQERILMSTITHDLKTPTNAQITAMDILLKETLGKLNDDQREIIQHSKNSNVYMKNMISTLIAAYKSEIQSIILEPQTFDYEDLVKTTIQELSMLAYTKNQNLVLESSLKDNMVTADKLQLKRAMINLIANAITYGFENTNIVISLKEVDENVSFDVTNNSHFIPQEKLAEIFEKFKTNVNAKFEKASTGLGLYLSKKIITKHNGQMRAQSFENQTCIFGFTVPRVFKEEKSQSKTTY